MSASHNRMQFGDGHISRTEFLRRQRDFVWMKSHGERFIGRQVVIQIAEAPDDETRLGIIVTRRFSLSAVIRNRARRLIRESFRLTRNNINRPIWIIMIARKGIAASGSSDVQRELIYFLRKANAFAGDCERENRCD